MSKPWHLQTGESDVAYQAFLVYRDLGPGRTLDKVAEERSEGKPSEQEGSPGVAANGRLFHWSSKHAWVDRCRAWDAHLQTIKDRATESEAARWAKRREASREAQWDTAQALRKKVETMLSFPLQRTTIEHYEDGRPKTIIEPARWTFQTAVRFARAVAELENAVLGPAPSDSAGQVDDMEAKAAHEILQAIEAKAEPSWNEAELAIR